MRLISLSLAWITGIYTGSLVSLPLYAFPPVLTLFLIIALLWHKRQIFLWGGLCLVVLFSGIGCYHWRLSEPILQSFNDQGIVEVRGKVERDPEFEGGFSRLSLSAQEIKTDNQWERVSGKVLIYTRALPYYSQGDSLKLNGELHSLSRIEDTDYRAYLTKQGFCSTMSYPQIDFIQRGWLFSLRNRLAQSLSSALAEPQGSLAQALLLGIRSHIPDSLRDSFRHSGTSHLIAISGLHVAILAGIVLISAAWLFGRHRPTYILVAFIILWFYALLTGMRPPGVRAAIMFSLFLTSLQVGRPRSAMPSLTLAAAIMVGINPQILWDVSFQLSSVAVAGLVLLAIPLFQPLRGWLKDLLGEGKGVTSLAIVTGESFIITLAAITATLPLIVYYFGYISLVGLPATLLALLALPAAIITSLIVAVLGLFAPPLSAIAGWVDWLLLSYIIEVVQCFSSLPFASHHVGPIDGAWIWTYYGFLLAILSRKRLTMAIAELITLGQKILGKG